ncbi:sugar ABC transporter ATP-binding protein [Isoptericola sp. b441]|uniref:Sugar ABC transporter ATP-binding protein n=1 Tax=Actinotalea lenta TaxID=3064654 RepID=A0ABT9D6R1_9CELL|nr:sugar ABC transporter ATP-binding protein [Isoptericola sp. b441]MDO8106516.1 sugar ABC transporter ATP-binding protein [Isoptericola sp. b441]
MSDDDNTARAPGARRVLEAHGLVKRYAGVTALAGVDFDLHPGEVHCLVGENGAGKSTLIKILTGAVTPDAGSIAIDGEDVTSASIRERRERGISVIYQDLNLVPQLTVAENIFLGSEPRTRLGMLDRAAMRRATEQLIADLGVPFAASARVGELGISLQQLTATARALALGGKVLIMDEPSAVLGGKELDVLFGVIRRLTAQGIGIVYISHRLEEIFEIGDRVTVLRDGNYVGTSAVADIDQAELVRRMVGRDVVRYENLDIDTPKGAEVLRVDSLTRRGVLRDVSLTVRAGEVVGIAGLVGAGRTELARAIMGLDAVDSGTVYLDGKPRRVTSAAKAVRLGLALVPEDRRAEGIVPMLSVRDNAALSMVRTMSKLGVVQFRRMYRRVGELARDLAVKVPDLRDPVSGLSGGNQQKVVLAKCLASDCRVLIMDEPTVGIDVGAKREIYSLIGTLKQRGLGVVVISSELPEILSISDRILVMSEGRIQGEVDPRTTTQEEILHLAIPPMDALAQGGAA